MSSAVSHSIFITGSTGYLGSRLIPLLMQRGYRVKALVRPGSEHKLSAPCESVLGDALQQGSYVEALQGVDTLVHLIGVAHPRPTKAAQFRSIDQLSAEVALHAAQTAGIRHFVYLSVAQPSSMMRDYVAVRAHCEAMIRRSGIVATFLRPWYVLGPEHRWPYVLLPFYWLLARLPATREAAQRLGLVTLTQMINALVWAIEHPPQDLQILDVPRIRSV